MTADHKFEQVDVTSLSVGGVPVSGLTAPSAAGQVLKSTGTSVGDHAWTIDDTPIVISAPNMTAPSGGTLGRIGTRFPAWLLDAALNEQVNNSFYLPDGWLTFNIDVLWANSAGGSGDVIFQTSWSKRGIGEDTSGGDQLGDLLTITAGAANILQSTRTISDAPTTDGQYYHSRTTRRGGDAGDTLPNDIGVAFVVISKAS